MTPLPRAGPVVLVVAGDHAGVGAAAPALFWAGAARAVCGIAPVRSIQGDPDYRGAIPGKLGAGRSFADLLEAYPALKEDDLRAALGFAADYLQRETVIAAES